MSLEQSHLVALCPVLFHQVFLSFIDILLVTSLSGRENSCAPSPQLRFVGVFCVHGSQVDTHSSSPREELQRNKSASLQSFSFLPLFLGSSVDSPSFVPFQLFPPLSPSLSLFALQVSLPTKGKDFLTQPHCCMPATNWHVVCANQVHG